MYIQKAKIVTGVIGVLIAIGGIIFQASQINELKEEVEESKNSIQKLEEEQIVNLEQNKALSEELDALQKDYRESLEEIESYEELIQEKDGKINKLEKDLLSKKEKEEQAKLAKAKSSDNSQKKGDKRGVSSNKEVVTASSSVKADSKSLGEFKVTHYAVGDGYTPGTKTANGTDVSNTIYSPEGHRIIAVDPNVIPMNSIVEVTIGGNTFLAKASDTGGAIKGNIIDLLVSSPSETRKLGIKKAHVRIIK